MKDQEGPGEEVGFGEESAEGALFRALVEIGGSECYDSARTTA